jgi:hypothetical protein
LFSVGGLVELVLNIEQAAACRTSVETLVDRITFGAVSFDALKVAA